MKAVLLIIDGVYGIHKTVPLTGKDIFTGPNGCGKTARIVAMKIAYAGFGPNPEKPNEFAKTPAKTMESAGFGLDKMSVGLVFDDGFKFTRTFERNTTGACSETINIEGTSLGYTEAKRFIQKKLKS